MYLFAFFQLSWNTLQIFSLFFFSLFYVVGLVLFFFHRFVMLAVGQSLLVKKTLFCGWVSLFSLLSSLFFLSQEREKERMKQQGKGFLSTVHLPALICVPNTSYCLYLDLNIYKCMYMRWNGVIELT